jgi:group I intron endonuclease
MSNTWILYKTTNVCNSKIYIGVHKLADNYRSKNYLGSGYALKTAIEKYGRENFVRVTLAKFSCSEDAYFAEAEMVTEEFCNRKDTYNLRIGGEGGIFTEETRAKMSAAGKGKKFTPDTIAKMSAAQKGRKHSEESRIKISNGNKGNKNFLGHQHSEETKAKISAAGKGRVFSKEHKTNMRQASTQTKPVIVNGEYYLSCRQAAELIKISRSTVRKRLENVSLEWSEWRYATEEEIASFRTKN